MKMKPFLFSIALVALLLIFNCGGSENGSGPSVVDQQQMLSNTADNIILPAYSNLSTRANRLKTWVEGFNADPNITVLLELRTRLQETRLAWQKCNIYEFGPASTIGLSSFLNIYPVDVNAIENNITQGNFDLEGIGAADQRGLQAVGYLLFGTDQTDQEIVDAFAETNRQTYLLTVVDLIRDKSEQTLEEWLESGGNYITTFKTATGVDVGSSLSIMLNAAIQSFERKTRDGKIGIPVGLRTLGIPIPEAVEGLYSVASVELAYENVTSFDDFLTGVGLDDSDGEGVLDYLKKVTNSDLDQTIKMQLGLVNDATENLEEPFHDEVVNNPDPANLAVAEMQKLLVLLKTDMASALGITITYIDNDGD